jgi:hypothetical protein
MDRIQRERDRLADRLSGIERKPMDWDLIKAEFGGAGNSFGADLELLKLRLPHAESAKQRKT